MASPRGPDATSDEQEELVLLARCRALLSAADSAVADSTDAAAAAAGSVYIRDRNAVLDKLQRLVRGGKDALHIISDFDFTMTRYWVNGERGPATHRVLSAYSGMSDSYKSMESELFHHFYPIEISTTHSHAEKYAAMEEWWCRVHDGIARERLTEASVAAMVTETPVTFREGVEELVGKCEREGVPFLVFSAGLYDVIKAILVRAGLKTPNLHIVSNRMKFDDGGVCVGFHEPTIHVMNKNEAGIRGSPYEQQVQGRRHAILLGDSLGDVQMAEGLSHDVVLTVGFLNHSRDAQLEAYGRTFDVVVLDDGPMRFLRSLLDAIVSGGRGRDQGMRRRERETREGNEKEI
ncbi:pyrimidine 5'-nucleotidase-domain-containing protein [Zopfochytrium polystomum]|nr:pyrimidine 5'-nucleotidase-domain-containing protein [Zopfochytrium polystomum]